MAYFTKLFIVCIYLFSLALSAHDASAPDLNSDGWVDVVDWGVLLSNRGAGRATTPTVTVKYTFSNEDFANPERGFMKQSNIWVDQPFDAGKISAVNSSDSVVWIYFHLENYRDPRDGKGITLLNYRGKNLEPLGSGKGLDTVNNAFAEARKKGLKLVIRYLYIGYSGIGSTGDWSQTEPDAPIELVRQHITQLTPLFEQNKDVITAIQTGFVGYWGEWHSSKYLSSITNRKAVLDALLAAVPKDRMLMLRYPRYKQLWFGGPLSDSTAYIQSDLARIGIHDDAFLRDDTDGGTFKSKTAGAKITNYCDGYPQGETRCWQDYVYKDSRFTPTGGEAGIHSSTPSQFALCPNALIALNNMHFSFLHNGYSKAVLDSWVGQGCMSEIRRRLGYRLILTEAKLPSAVTPGSTLDLQIQLKNEGFAAMYNPRPVYLVIKNAASRREILLSKVDPRRWQAGQTHTLNAAVTIPANMAPGTYHLALWLPDQADSLRQNPQYAVRFANTGVWESSTGLNILTKDFKIQKQ